MAGGAGAAGAAAAVGAVAAGAAAAVGAVAAGAAAAAAAAAPPETCPGHIDSETTHKTQTRWIIYCRLHNAVTQISKFLILTYERDTGSNSLLKLAYFLLEIGK